MARNAENSSQVELKIVFNFKAGKDGERSVTFDSPYQGAYGIAGEMNFISADSINVTVSHIGLTFSGRKQNGMFIGKCSHGAMSTNLELSSAKCISDTRCPIFTLYGEKDIQIRPELNMLPMRQLATNVDVKLYPGLNHLFQHVQTEAVQESCTIEETFFAEVLVDIVDSITIAIL